MDNLKQAVADGGYGWVVCVAGCIVQFLVSGLQSNFGILYIYILKDLSDGRKAKAAWIGSINIGAMFLVSPLVTTLCRRLGCRLTGIIGGLFCVLGLGLSSLTRNIDWLCVTYGVIAGIGCGLCYITTFRVFSLWFQRRLVLVNYLGLMWDAAGRAVTGPCLQRALASVGLSRTFLLLAGIFTISALVAFLYKPTAHSEGKQVMCDNRKNHRWFDFSVMKHKPYMSFVVATGVLSVAFSVTYVHVPSFAKEVGIPEEKTALLISVEAPSTLVAVLLLVKIVDYFSSYRLQFYQMGFLLFAVSQTFTAEARTFASFVALMVAYGLASGVAVPLKPVLAEQILGKDRASEGVGFLFGILGFSYISGPPLVGWIYDMSHSYPLAFLVSGGLSALASCILFLVPMFQENVSISEESSSEKKMTLEERFSNNCKYPKLCHEDLRLQKIICFKLQTWQIDTLQKDWTQVVAEAKETDV